MNFLDLPHKPADYLTNSEVEEMAAAQAESSPAMLVSDDDWNAYLEMSYVHPTERNI